jgi:H+/gluconate symporter-like permease
MKSKVGIGLCLVYALIIAVCLAASVGADNKGAFVFKQLPIALQMAAIPQFLYPMLENISWLNAYLLLATPTFLLLYFFGWLLEGGSKSYNKNATK